MRWKNAHPTERTASWPRTVKVTSQADLKLKTGDFGLGPDSRATKSLTVEGGAMTLASGTEVGGDLNFSAGTIFAEGRTRRPGHEWVGGTLDGTDSSETHDGTVRELWHADALFSLPGDDLWTL